MRQTSHTDNSRCQQQNTSGPGCGNRTISRSRRNCHTFLTTAEKLAQDYDFLADESTRSEFDEENRSNAVSILFKTGSATLLPEYRNNSRNLDLLVDIILKINQSPDSRISHILIAGYASPDGDIRINSDFATLRAAALKKYLMRHTRLDSGTFEVINGKIDWYGLSQMVGKSDMLDKETVLNILSVIPSREARANVAERTNLCT